MTLRRAKADDKEGILRVARLLHLDMPGFIWDRGDFIDRQIKAGDYFVVEEEGEIIGAISFRQRQDKVYIETIAIVNNHRDKGIGTKLIEFAKEFTREKGLRSLRLCSFYDYNTVDFYLSQGFSLLKKPGKYQGHQYHRFEMKLDY